MELRDYLYKHHLQNRKLLRKFLLSLTPEQANNIPLHCRNNVVWNCAHVISVQQSLVHYMYGLPMNMEKSFVKEFTAGTKPEYYYTQDFIDSLAQQLMDTSLQMQEDIGHAEPECKSPFSTAIKVDLTKMNETLSFVNYHEGLHLGVITGLIKWVS